MRLFIAVIAAAALPLFAETPKPSAETHPVSPLAAAAKRANRLGRMPANVITNETVGRGSGRVSWASGAATAAGTPAQENNSRHVAAEREASSPRAAAPAPRAAAQAPAAATTYDGSSRVSRSMPTSSAGFASPGSTVGTTPALSTANSNTLASTVAATSRPSSATVTSPSSAATHPVD